MFRSALIGKQSTKTRLNTDNHNEMCGESKPRRMFCVGGVWISQSYIRIIVLALGSTHIAIEFIQEMSRILSIYSSFSLSQVPQMIQQNKSIMIDIVLSLWESLLRCISEITVTSVEIDVGRALPRICELRMTASS